MPRLFLSRNDGLVRGRCESSSCTATSPWHACTGARSRCSSARRRHPAPPPPAAVYVVAPRTVDLGDDAAGLASMGAFVITNTSWWPHLSMEDPPWESTSPVSATDALSLALWRYVPAPHTP
eukprot:COSAG01_NODE_1208_length_11239_cov_36.000987_18_plen_122_part_00